MNSRLSSRPMQWWHIFPFVTRFHMLVLACDINWKTDLMTFHCPCRQTDNRHGSGAILKYQKITIHVPYGVDWHHVIQPFCNWSHDTFLIEVQVWENFLKFWNIFNEPDFACNVWHFVLFGNCIHSQLNSTKMAGIWFFGVFATFYSGNWVLGFFGYMCFFAKCPKNKPE